MLFEFDLTTLILASLLFVAALLYASVGHAGASGYLAVMALAGVSPAVMKPTALALNIVVAMIATYRYYRAGSFSWKLFLPLALSAIPMAYIGGGMTLPVQHYKPLVGVVLLYAAWHSFRTANHKPYEIRSPSNLILLMVGSALGLLSGLTGVGGGIFLSPILLVLHWTQVKVISGIAAAFILVNSIAGLLGMMSTNTPFHPALPLWMLVVLVGGAIGAEYGSKRLGNPAIKRLLSIVLLIAAIKMIALV
jgi:uncharacterized membrane protein YfcA